MPRIGRVRCVLVAFGVLAGGCARAALSSGEKAVRTGTLKIVGMSPAPGSQLSRDSTIDVDLEYTTDPFFDNDFLIIAQFDTTREKWTTDGGYPLRRRYLDRPNGTFHLSYPVRYVWDDRKVKRPFRIHFLLVHMTGFIHARAVARTETFEYLAR